MPCDIYYLDNKLTSSTSLSKPVDATDVDTPDTDTLCEQTDLISLIQKIRFEKQALVGYFPFKLLPKNNSGHPRNSMLMQKKKTLAIA